MVGDGGWWLVVGEVVGDGGWWLPSKATPTSKCTTAAAPFALNWQPVTKKSRAGGYHLSGPKQILGQQNYGPLLVAMSIAIAYGLFSFTHLLPIHPLVASQ